MQSAQQTQQDRNGKIAKICAFATVVLGGLASTPQAEHFGGLWADSLRFSFCARPPAFDSIGLFATSLKASSLRPGFGEIDKMQAVLYHPISKAPLKEENYSSPELFSIKGNLVERGRTKDGGYYFDLGDEKKALIRIIATWNLLREWNPLTPMGHRAVLTFKQRPDSPNQGKTVTISGQNGKFCMELGDARFEY